MDRFRLFFVDPSLERSYQKFNQPFVHKQFYDYFRLQIVLMLVMTIVGIIDNHDFSARIIGTIIGLLFFLILLPYIKRFTPKVAFQSVIILFCSSIGFLFVELVHMSLNAGGYVEKSACFMLLVFQFYLDIILLTRIGWIYTAVLYIINVLYFYFRFTLYNSQMGATAIVGGSILIFNFAVIAYRHEKTSREYFKSLQDSNESLKKFKEVMQSILPSPIIITNYDEKKIAFMNDSAQEMFKKRRKTEYSDNQEKNPFVIEEDDKVLTSLEYFEETINSFKLLKHDLLNINDDQTMTISSLMRRFFIDSMKCIQFDGVLANDFITIHITDNKEKNGEIESCIFEKNTKKLLKIHYYEVKVCNINWENKRCILLIFNDQTKAKRLLELMDLDRYKNEMLATISHDLRTPLNGVMGMMWSVLPFLKDKDAKKNLMIGIRSANLLNFLINDILDFSQMTYKKLRLNYEKVNITDLANEIIALIKIQTKKKFINLIREFLIEENEEIYSDSVRLKQILLNLLGNAIKFTNQGGTITLKIDSISSEKFIKFSVIDTGIGIKAEEISKIFMLFGKLKQENPEINKTGIGFGLTISQNLANYLNPEENGGIKVESEYGKGSTFSFIIQKRKDEIENDDDEYVRNMNESISMNIVKYNSHSTGSIEKSVFNSNFNSNSSFFSIHNNKKVLIVDDDPVNILIMEQYLLYFKIEYCSAMNGMEALKLIQKDVIDEDKEISVILMDCNMPILDGFKASEAIIDLLKKHHKHEIPIIGVTANVTNDDMELCFKSGMKKYLPKPVRRRDLGIELQQLLSIKLNID